MKMMCKWVDAIFSERVYVWKP